YTIIMNKKMIGGVILWEQSQN
ncbi:hypothetical protein A5872_002624, partial [Enterococcus faecium]